MNAKLPQLVSPSILRSNINTLLTGLVLLSLPIHAAPDSKKSTAPTPQPSTPSKSQNSLPLPIADEPLLIKPTSPSPAPSTPSPKLPNSSPATATPSSATPTAPSPFIEYHKGELPIIFTAPHGGREKPDHIPDRVTGNFAFDTNTEELAQTISEVFQQRCGKAPHLLICKLTRAKVDCNREIGEGAGNQTEAINAWNTYHRSIDSALETILKTYPTALLIDLHGHGHKEERIEIGYCHNPRILSLTDPEFNQPTTIAAGSIETFAKTTTSSYVDLIRGPQSLGSLLEKGGFPSTPSSSVRLPPPPYFNGGYTTKTYGTLDRKCAAIQLETNYTAVRDNDANRTRFANALYDALKTYLAAHTQLTLPPVVPPPAPATPPSTPPTTPKPTTPAKPTTPPKSGSSSNPPKK